MFPEEEDPPSPYLRVQEIMDQLTMGKVEERWMKTHDGEDMLTMIIYPPNFDPNKSYPALLYCKGGPQGPLSQNFHYRWNYFFRVGRIHFGDHMGQAASHARTGPHVRRHVR